MVRTKKRRHAELAAHLRARGVPVTWADAERAFSEHAVKACVRQGTVRRVLPGVLVHSTLAQDRATRIRAVALWTSDADGAITGVAALWLWGVRLRVPATTMVMVRHPLHRAHPPWVRPYRPRNPPEPVMLRGIRVTPIAHAVVHAWNESVGETAVGLVVEAVGRKHVSAGDVAAAVATTGRVRARKRLLALLELLTDGITSYLEHRARTTVFVPEKFPELKWQVTMVICGKVRTPDIFDPVSRTAIELDSTTWHGEVKDRVADIERDAEFAAEGILCLRMDFDAIFTRPEWCQAMYRRARAQRLSPGAASDSFRPTST